MRLLRAGVDAVQRRLAAERSCGTSPSWRSLRWFVPWCIGFMQGRDLAFMYVRPSDFTRIYGLVVSASVFVALVLLALAVLSLTYYIFALCATFVGGVASEFTRHD